MKVTLPGALKSTSVCLVDSGCKSDCFEEFQLLSVSKWAHSRQAMQDQHFLQYGISGIWRSSGDRHYRNRARSFGKQDAHEQHGGKPKFYPFYANFASRQLEKPVFRWLQCTSPPGRLQEGCSCDEFSVFAWACARGSTLTRKTVGAQCLWMLQSITCRCEVTKTRHLVSRCVQLGNAAAIMFVCSNIRWRHDGLTKTLGQNNYVYLREVVARHCLAISRWRGKHSWGEWVRNGPMAKSSCASVPVNTSYVLLPPAEIPRDN